MTPELERALTRAEYVGMARRMVLHPMQAVQILAHIRDLEARLAEAEGRQLCLPCKGGRCRMYHDKVGDCYGEADHGPRRPCLHKIPAEPQEKER